MPIKIRVMPSRRQRVNVFVVRPTWLEYLEQV